jgi:hypothetical protein
MPLEPRLVKLYLCSRLREINILEKRPVCIMALLFDCCAEFKQLVWYGLISCLKDVDETIQINICVLRLIKDHSRSRLCFIMLRE